MLRLALIATILIPATVLAQAPAATPKAAAPKAAAPKAPAPAPAAVKPAAATPAAAIRPPVRAAAPMTDDQKTIYAIGMLMQRSLESFDLSAAELEIVKRGMTDAALGRPAIVLDEWGPRIAPLERSRAERLVVRQKSESVAYLQKSAAEVGAVKTASGLVYRQVSAGTGASPKATDTVRVHYRGTLVNGTEFDSSYSRNEPGEFVLSGVIGCWTEGVQKMKVGGKARLVCPSELAYGDDGAPTIPGGATLIFEIELLEILGSPE